MSTDRLYYTDSYCREFDAVVDQVDRAGGRAVVVLDRTAFYPTSGGQPFDVGTLAGHGVVDVFDEADGVVKHVIEEPPGATGELLGVGQPVRGTVDWARRFDHMQQHTGQHVLSAVIERLSRAKTVSFHLGIGESTIDLDRELTVREVASAERAANEVVWNDLALAIRFVTPAQAATLPLRKPVQGALEDVRLVEIGDVDLSACGGTHVARTGSIGSIAVTAWERFKGGQRLTFLCGGRALGRFDALRDTVAAGVRLLSVLPDEVPSAIEKLQSESREQRRALVALQGTLTRYQAEELAAAATATSAGRLAMAQLDLDASGLKAMAAAITAKSGHIAVLVSSSSPRLMVVARAVDVAIAANSILSTMLARFGGRGGGKADMAQGGGLSGSAEEILAAARDAIAVPS